ncbi:MAG: hypothetical protein LBN00_03535 [Oscillospiraceae bacterium]|jgi:peptidoglycan hydrolase CwlO-like protein|nr:hypothetical protein [Oscillospiraceae bacterium]
MSETMQSAPLMGNEYVIGLLDMMRENRTDTSELTAVIDYVVTIERGLNTAVAELANMRRELAEMREIQGHPVKTELQNAIRSLESKINAARERIGEVKDAIIDGCKRALTAFKEKGESALNDVMSFFHLKGGLKAVNKSLNEGIRECDSAIMKIDNFSREYHSAGRHLKNMARVAVGKEAISSANAIGKLAWTFNAPYRASKTCLLGAKRAVNAAIRKLEQLEQSVSARAEKKPSTRENMKVLKSQLEQAKKDAPVPKHDKKRENTI